MDIRDVRLQRLHRLLQEQKGAKKTALASLIRKSPSQISQWLSGYRTITEDSAREIERNAKKPHGWMDEAHPTTAAPPVDAPQVRFTLEHALPVVLDALRDAQHRDELRRLLPLLVDTDAPAYRQRLAELLSGQTGKRQATG